jgi:hypothetical protein
MKLSKKNRYFFDLPIYLVYLHVYALINHHIQHHGQHHLIHHHSQRFLDRILVSHPCLASEVNLQILKIMTKTVFLLFSFAYVALSQGYALENQYPDSERSSAHAISKNGTDQEISTSTTSLSMARTICLGTVSLFSSILFVLFASSYALNNKCSGLAFLTKPRKAHGVGL